MGCEDITCSCLSSVEDGVETAGASEGEMGCEDITYGCLSSVEDKRRLLELEVWLYTCVEYGSLLPYILMRDAPSSLPLN